MLVYSSSSLQVQQEVCKAIPMCCTAPLRVLTDSLQSESEVEEPHSSPAWPPAAPGFVPFLAHSRGQSPAAVTAQGLHLPELSRKLPLWSFLTPEAVVTAEAALLLLQQAPAQQGEGDDEHSSAAKQKKPSHVLQLWDCPYCDSPTNKRPISPPGAATLRPTQSDPAALLLPETASQTAQSRSLAQI